MICGPCTSTVAAICRPIAVSRARGSGGGACGPSKASGRSSSLDGRPVHVLHYGVVQFDHINTAYTACVTWDAGTDAVGA
jgi:hypothetical protein